MKNSNKLKKSGYLGKYGKGLISANVNGAGVEAKVGVGVEAKVGESSKSNKSENVEKKDAYKEDPMKYVDAASQATTAIASMFDEGDGKAQKVAGLVNNGLSIGTSIAGYRNGTSGKLKSTSDYLKMRCGIKHKK